MSIERHDGCGEVEFIKAVIFAQGEDLSLWPLSRTRYPKQFVKVSGGQSLFQYTYKLASKLLGHDDILIAAGDVSRVLVKNDLEEMGSPFIEENIIGISDCDNDIACTAIAQTIVDFEMIIVLTCEYIVDNSNAFIKALNTARTRLKDGIITFAFKGGKSSNIFILNNKKLFGRKDMLFEYLGSQDTKVQKTRVNSKLTTVSGISSLLHDVRESDVGLNSRNNVVCADNSKVVVTVGTHDLIIADSKDALLVCRKNNAKALEQAILAVQEKRDEVTNCHLTDHRPWGSYEVLEEHKKAFKVKRIEVKAAHKLSYQLHKHRDEHWVIVAGKARVTLDGTIHELIVGDHIYIKAGMAHRIENTGDDLMEFVEVQLGSYLEEDDIVRLSDDYGRGQTGMEEQEVAAFKSL